MSTPLIFAGTFDIIDISTKVTEDTMKLLALKFIFLITLLGYIAPENGATQKERLLSAGFALTITSTICKL